MIQLMIGLSNLTLVTLAEAGVFSVPSVMQYGAFGVVCAAFGWLLVWQQNLFRNELKSVVLTNTAVMSILQALGQQLAIHHLQVSGVNPSTGKDAEERDAKCFATFSEFIRISKETKSSIDTALAAAARLAQQK